ncbi:hypothetical protein FB560_2862 [Microbacterium saperdae]|uniref:Uncharacterized protein n=1 Tax=Microbacterium saperdae TaxID=69368 RepID=A0A543BQU1_9MICO|nr:hypothetical protein FB560_2862 [Microbacterium saperdae]
MIAPRVVIDLNVIDGTGRRLFFWVMSWETSSVGEAL